MKVAAILVGHGAKAPWVQAQPVIRPPAIEPALEASHHCPSFEQAPQSKTERLSPVSYLNRSVWLSSHPKNSARPAVTVNNTMNLLQPPMISCAACRRRR